MLQMKALISRIQHMTSGRLLHLQRGVVSEPLQLKELCQRVPKTPEFGLLSSLLRLSFLACTLTRLQGAGTVYSPCYSSSFATAAKSHNYNYDCYCYSSQSPVTSAFDCSFG